MLSSSFQFFLDWKEAGKTGKHNKNSDLFKEVAKRQIKHLIYAAKLQLFSEITKGKNLYFRA